MKPEAQESVAAALTVSTLTAATPSRGNAALHFH